MKYTLPEPIGERIPNLAPMVDIIMVLLVFFMLGASMNLITEGSLRSELDPRSGPGGGVAVDIIPAVKIGLQDIDAGQSCGIFVNGEPIGTDAFEELRRFLEGKKAAGADTTGPVVIGAESTVRWKHVIRAMDHCIAAGFENVQFAVRLDGPAVR